MPRYLISFDDGDMDIPAHDVPAVDAAAHAVVRAAREAGVWIVGGGMAPHPATIVAPDGAVTQSPYPAVKKIIGGFVIIEVPSREIAVDWVGRFARACRCPQEVREIMFDPHV